MCVGFLTHIFTIRPYSTPIFFIRPKSTAYLLLRPKSIPSSEGACFRPNSILCLGLIPDYCDFLGLSPNYAIRPYSKGLIGITLVTILPPDEGDSGKCSPEYQLSSQVARSATSDES